MNVQTTTLPKKIVAVMFENQSFDRILGYLWPWPSDPHHASFEGVSKNSEHLSNPVPPDIAAATGVSSISVYRTNIFDLANFVVDPCEEYACINTDLFNCLDPNNKNLQGNVMVSPYNLPSQPPTIPSNQGFITSYVNQLRANGNLTYLQNVTDFGSIMGCLPPSEIPVITQLANSSCVFDHWFVDVPSQTYPNRMFWDSGTSQGAVNDHIPDPDYIFTTNTQKTIYNQLHEANKTWYIYTDNVFPFTLVLHIPMLLQFYPSHFRNMSQFVHDAANGQLPDYSFVEPIFIGAPEDYHPPDEDSSFANHSSILAGEQFLANVYNAIKTSPNASEILFAITFDEVGGTYDHVPPPATNPPDNFPGEDGFGFDRLGLRVPMIWVNCFIEPGSTIHKPLQHTSFLHVIRTLLGLPDEPLTDRDRHAPKINLNNIFGNTCNPLPNVTPRTDYPNPPLGITAYQSQFESTFFEAILTEFGPLLAELGIHIP